MKQTAAFLRSLGVRNQQNVFVAAQARIFNGFNLFGLINGILRFIYLLIFSPETYSPTVIALNLLPVILSVIMMCTMYASRLAVTAAISFIFFPPLLLMVYRFTGDLPGYYYILFYLIFPFFFLQKSLHMILAFGLAVACFILAQDVVVPLDHAALTGEKDHLLYYFDYMMLMVFAFGCLYSIRNMLWKYQRHLSRQRAELQELIGFRDKIFSIVTHDLRTPLAATAQLVDLLEYTRIEQNEFDTYISELKGNLSSTRAMMDNMLFWAKAQLNEETLNEEQVDLEVLCEEVLRSAEVQAATKQLDLKLDIKSHVMAATDPAMVKIILSNLLNNAIKFTPEGGQIEVKTEMMRGRPVISVSDNGIGIPADKKDSIFGKEFYSTPGTGREIGSGLGLKICRDLAAKCGIGLDFESEAGKGTTFYLSLNSSEISLFQVRQQPQTAELQPIFG